MIKKNKKKKKKLKETLIKNKRNEVLSSFEINKIKIILKINLNFFILIFANKMLRLVLIRTPETLFSKNLFIAVKAL